MPRMPQRWIVWRKLMRVDEGVYPQFQEVVISAKIRWLVQKLCDPTQQGAKEVLPVQMPIQYGPNPCQ
jgi:hypothetical protein